MSSSTERPGRIVVGHVRRAHGLKGEVVVGVQSDDPARFAPGQMLRSDETPPRSLTIERTRPGGSGTVIVSFRGLVTRSEAELLKGRSLTIASDERRELEDGEYWPDQLVGLVVVSPSGLVLGTVREVLLSDLQDRLIIESANGSEVEVPFVDELVPDVSLEDGSVTVVPIPGLFS